MFMVFYRGFALSIDLLRELISRWEALANSEHTDALMIRFSLVRLTSTLGDWIQDYPGDFNNHETLSLLREFHQRLLQHPATVHTAAPLQSFIDGIPNAPDIDTTWAYSGDGEHAGDLDPAGANSRPLLLNSSNPDIAATLDMAGRSAAPSGESSPMPTTLSLPPENDSPDPGLGLEHENSGPGRISLGEPPKTGRHRSGSDVTSSSAEGSGGGNSKASPRPAQSSFVPPAPPSPAPPPVARSGEAQLSALRSVSNALTLIDDSAIAAELNRLEWKVFSTIGPRDLLRHILVSREQREPNGPVAMSIAHFNYISSWVCSIILAQSKAKQRARLLEKFMNIATILRKENNYNTLQSVLAGLGNTSVHRLNQTRDLVMTKPIHKAFQSLTRLMKSDRSFYAYRLALENSGPRTIPFLGVHLQDILSISDGNPSRREDGAVHWRKFALMDEAVTAIVRCQQYGRSHTTDANIEKLIMDVPVMDEDTLWERSLVVEPRQSSGTGPRNIIRKMQGVP